MTYPEQLLSELHSHRPADLAEAGHRERMVKLLTGNDDPFSRGHFQPGHFTASCFIVDAGGRLLLHHHRRLNRWLQMGGHVEAGESAWRAALREGAEESGLRDLALNSGIFDLDIHGIPAANREPDHDHFDIRFIARTAAPETIAIDRSESKELAWVTLDRAADLMPGPESIRVIRKLRERRLH